MNRFNWIKNTLIIFASFFLLANLSSVLAEEQPTPTPAETAPLGCPDKNGQRGNACYLELNQIYQDQDNGEKCTVDYAEFKSDPAKYHFWVEDSEITAQGKSNDRARQFIYWVTTHAAINNHPVLTKVWGISRNLSYFFVILTAALLGLGIIIGQRTNFETGIKLWPAITKILLAILYIAFSATIVITIVQLSEIMMKFFIENLGGSKLFNIYFSGISQEKNYVNFVGCRDLNIRVQEAAKTEILMLKLTSWGYYFMGGMLLLREIILWFLLFVSPFLAILLSFAFIKNIGTIWIRVFFQWVFYGPLLALFLGGLASIWQSGIPFIFDFSRINTTAGYIYPTAINILYGGPAQTLTVANNGNYVDTFVEYIITLIMLWAVTIFPWFLLRTLRDYCCEGINAMKNMMLANLNPGHPNGPAPFPTPSPTNLNSNVGVEMKIPRETETTVKTRIETIEEIKRAKTEDISRSLNIKATNITDIAHFETNKTLNETTNKNINYLKNPIQASTPAERQKYMNIRSELSSRAARSDLAARQIINVFTASKTEQSHIRQNIITSLPKMIPVTQIVSFKVKLSQEKVQQISSAITNTVINNRNTIEAISQKAGVGPEKTTQVINMLHQNINTPATEIVQRISTNTNMEKEKVSSVIKEFSTQVKKVVDAQVPVAQMISVRVNLSQEKVQQISSAITNTVINNRNTIEAISQKAGVGPEKTTQVINMLHQNINTPATEIVQRISTNTNMEKEKVSSVIKEFSTQVKFDIKIIEAVAKENNVNNEQVNKIIDAQVLVIAEPEKNIEQIVIIPQTVSIDEYEQVKSKLVDQYKIVTEPEKNIEQTVIIPQTVSIDEYEEVKKMWTQQYEKGEVPVTENIKTRGAWVDQDIVIITNTLNKLFSTDEKIKGQGLDDVGYILPIFLVNNLTGEQLVAYLKAKIEAAKMVKALIDREKEVTERLKAGAEETIDVLKLKKKEEEKTMEMKEELDEVK